MFPACEMPVNKIGNYVEIPKILFFLQIDMSIEPKIMIVLMLSILIYLL